MKIFYDVDVYLGKRINIRIRVTYLMRLGDILQVNIPHENLAAVHERHKL